MYDMYNCDDRYRYIDLKVMTDIFAFSAKNLNFNIPMNCYYYSTMEKIRIIIICMIRIICIIATICLTLLILISFEIYIERCCRYFIMLTCHQQFYVSSNETDSKYVDNIIAWHKL